MPKLVELAPQDWRKIGEEVTERLDYEPARFLRRRTVRPKYVQRRVLDAVPLIAPLPPALLERSIVAPGLLAQIVVAKYCDHLPLYRQESIIPVDFSGTIQCDGYEAYDCFAKGRGEKIVLAGCLAHVRRKFYEAKETAPKVAGWFLCHFKNLYGLEATLRQSRVGPRRRQAERASLSQSVLARLHRALVRLKTARRYLPKSLMGKAIDYALNQWPSLQLFLEDGRLEIDNNLVENAIRPTAIGKKNWLFFGEAEAGERSTILYTIIESCRRRGIDAFAYLRDVFARLLSMTNWQIKNITPKAWAKSRSSSTNQRAVA